MGVSSTAHSLESDPSSSQPSSSPRPSCSIQPAPKPSPSMASACILDAEEKSAVQFLARGFRAGVLLRPLFNATEEAYGSLAWSSIGAQEALIAATVSYIPKNAASDFTFGLRRCARFVCLLVDEIDRLGTSAVPCDALIDLAVTHATSSWMTVDEQYAYITIDVPTSRVGSEQDVGRERPVHEIVLRHSLRSSDLGKRLWEAGCVLFLSLLRSPLLRSDIVGRSVLELGSGLGLSGVALRGAGASRTVLSDISEDVLDNLRVNCGPPSVALRYTTLDICDLRKVAEVSTQHSVDTVIAADITYDPTLAVAAVRAIEEVLCAGNGSRHKVGYLFATSRTEASDRALRNAFARAALDVENVPIAIDSDVVKDSSFGIMLHCNNSWSFCNVRLYRLT